jgi:hypothetical protein
MGEMPPKSTFFFLMLLLMGEFLIPILLVLGVLVGIGILIGKYFF